MSYDNVDNIIIDDFIYKWSEKSKFFKCNLRNEKLSQFEHYNLLLNENTFDWVLFTDDDDLWNVNRVEFYLSKIIETNRDVILIDHIVYNTDMFISNIQDLVSTNKSRVCEYFNYSLKADIAKTIIDDISNNICPLSTNIFDIYFNIELSDISEEFKSENFLYYYRMCIQIDGPRH